MRRFIRDCLRCLLALCVFSQGIAAAGMACCPPSPTASHGHAVTPSDAPAGLPPSADHAHHAAPVADEAPGSAAEHDAHPDNSHASPGGACCVAAAPPRREAITVPPDLRASTPWALVRLDVSFLSEGLERPPRSSIA